MNRSIQGVYPPGSVLKLIAAAYALDNNIISKDWTVDCKGVYDFYGETYSCWNESGHGPTNLIESIRHSCNDWHEFNRAYFRCYKLIYKFECFIIENGKPVKLDFQVIMEDLVYEGKEGTEILNNISNYYY